MPETDMSKDEILEVELFRSVITSGQGAIKSIFLLNGGACIGVLTMLGRSDTSPKMIVSSLLFFALGTAFAALVSGGTYLCQWLYTWDHRVVVSAKKNGTPLPNRSEYYSKGNKLLCVVSVSWVVALILFITGCFLLYFAFS